jgi:hypothetical protein
MWKYLGMRLEFTAQGKVGFEARSGGRRATSPARFEAVAEQSTGRHVCDSGEGLGRGFGEEGHDVHAVSWKDREMRVVLEETGGGLDGLGLNDDVAAEGIRGAGDAVLCHARRLADHAATIG